MIDATLDLASLAKGSVAMREFLSLTKEFDCIGKCVQLSQHLRLAAGVFEWWNKNNLFNLNAWRLGIVHMSFASQLCGLEYKKNNTDGSVPVAIDDIFCESYGQRNRCQTHRKSDRTCINA